MNIKCNFKGRSTQPKHVLDGIQTLDDGSMMYLLKKRAREAEAVKQRTSTANK
jgi:hypothetical protein